MTDVFQEGIEKIIKNKKSTKNKLIEQGNALLKQDKDELIDMLYGALSLLLAAKNEKKINGKTPAYANLKFFAWEEAKHVNKLYNDFKKNKLCRKSQY